MKALAEADEQEVVAEVQVSKFVSVCICSYSLTLLSFHLTYELGLTDKLKLL